MASDIFLKIAFPHESLAQRVDHQLIKLGTDFDRLGESFLDLIADALKFNDVPGRAHDALIKHDVQSTGLDFIKLGDDFLRLDDVLHKFDDAILDFMGHIKFSSGEIGTDQGAPNLGDHFLKLDADLKLTGLDTITLGQDFLKLSDSQTENPNTAFELLGADFHKLDDRLSNVGDDFLAIGLDFQKLGDIKIGDIQLGDIKLTEIGLGHIKFDDSDVLKIDAAFTMLGTDTVKIGTDFHKVSEDFQQIASDIAQATDSGLTLKIDGLALKIASDFSRLDTDVHTLDADLKLLGNDYAKLSDAFHDAFHSGNGPPDVRDTLGQVLELAHHFSLL